MNEFCKASQNVSSSKISEQLELQSTVNSMLEKTIKSAQAWVLYGLSTLDAAPSNHPDNNNLFSGYLKDLEKHRDSYRSYKEHGLGLTVFRICRQQPSPNAHQRLQADPIK